MSNVDRPCTSKYLVWTNFVTGQSLPSVEQLRGTGGWGGMPPIRTAYRERGGLFSVLNVSS